MLASVTSIEEALIALDAGVDMIDLKNPAAGALGALTVPEVTDIVLAIHQRRRLNATVSTTTSSKTNATANPTISATIGDLPMQAQLIADATKAMLETGIDIVKIGFFGHSHHAECLEALSALAKQGKLIAVLFADEAPNFDLLTMIADAGFYGVMLDTAHKNGQHLLNHMHLDELSDFVNRAKLLGLETGLAGSIQAPHIQDLALLKPSYLGFRGALCELSQRTSKISPDKISSLKKQFC
jgi:uncharacterized protein (UPF0264 family)